MDLKDGQVLAGKYRIERVLGQGGMGIVVAATHLQLGERVALKFLLPEALSNPDAVARFAREARAAVRIKSEHVARVSDVGTLENGAPYMVMEYLAGGDLADWLKQRGALTVEQAVEFVLQACEAIAEAHALGIVHRDLKPANLFVIQRADGVLAVKVLDFGISKATELGVSGSMTATAAIMGSPYYMSPEQMHSAKDTDPRSDIWALGVVLFELLSGQYPFQADAMPELVLKIACSPPLALNAFAPSVPPGLEAVILRCLEKDRAARYQTIGALALALLEFAPRRSKSSVERISGIMHRAGMSSTAVMELPPSSQTVSARSQSISSGTQASWGQTAPPPSGRRRVVFALLGVGALVGVAGAGYAFSRSRAALPDPAASAGAEVKPNVAAVAAAPANAPEVIPQALVASANVPSTPPVAAQPSANAPEPAAIRQPRVNVPTTKPPPRPVVAAKSAKTAVPATPAPPVAAPPPVNPLKMKIE